jgi:hypothetical protein
VRLVKGICVGENSTVGICAEVTYFLNSRAEESESRTFGVVEVGTVNVMQDDDGVEIMMAAASESSILGTGDAPVASDGSTIVILSRGRLGAVPNSQRDNISVVHCHELRRAHLRINLLSLLCFEFWQPHGGSLSSFAVTAEVTGKGSDVVV